jgi:4'-phosphopantetheinyl transferase
VWLEKVEPALWEQYRGLLSAEEETRAARYAHEPSRLQFLAGRALLRTVLSHYLDDDARAFQFQYNPYGKPALKSPCRLPLEFNLSNTRGLVVCAVTLGHAVGVDVESSDRKTDFLKLARHYFAPPEAAALERLPAEQQPRRFMDLWTLKEAYIKARGMGLSLPLDSFAFSLVSGRAPEIAFRDNPGGSPADWQFAQLEPGGDRQIALAVEMTTLERMSIRVRQTVPLRWQEPGRLLPPNPACRWQI